MFFRALAGLLEGKAQHAVHTVAGHHRFLHDDLARCALEHAPADTGVFAFSVLAHDEHVDLARQARAAVAPHHRRGDAGHEARGAQVHILVKLAAEQQQ